jgi:hypothetical protein
MTELRLPILDEQSARIYAIPLCGCVEEVAERAQSSRQCGQNTYLDVTAPRIYTGVAVIVAGALRVGSPVSVVWRRSAVGAVGSGAGCAAVRVAQGMGREEKGREATSSVVGFRILGRTAKCPI